MRRGQITKQYEIHDLPSQDLDHYENRVMNSESLLQVIEVIYQMFKDLTSVMFGKKTLVPPIRSLSTNQNNLHFLSYSEEFGGALSKRESKEEQYLNLEKILQKYEADIRSHVRIEQQMKIYTDSLQETIEEKERTFANQLKSKQNEIKV